MPKSDKVLLIGNGINQITHHYSWSTLLKDLIDFAQMTHKLSFGSKPFPLFYEEIYLSSKKFNAVSEFQFKKKIVELLSNISHSELHKVIIEKGFPHLLTPNYDYNFEEAAQLGKGQKANLNPETKYSVYRCRQYGEFKIWHIHGEQARPLSILLGFEQYSGYLQKIRNYFFQRTQIGATFINSLSTRIGVHDDTIYSWVDLFFFKNIYILGFGFDYNELHLWWILNIRARSKIVESKSNINNKIYYLYPSFEAALDGYSDKIELLRANRVLTEPINVPHNDYKAFYDKTLEFIDKH